MGILYDFFTAPSDDEAVSVIGRVGGPGSQEVAVERPRPEKRGLFGRKSTKTVVQVEVDPSLNIYDTVPLRGIDPVVQLGTLEEMLTGRPYDEVLLEDRVLASEDGGERLVVSLSDGLVGALSEATNAALAEVAVPWSQTEEFWGSADPAELAENLQQLAELARRAKAGGHRVYCWVSV